MGTNSVKYDEARADNPLLPEQNLPMWIADMDFSAPPEVIGAIKRRADHGVFGYTELLDEGYYSAVINWMKTRHNWTPEKEWLMFSPGIVDAIDLAVEQLTQPGDAVLLQTPAYHPFDSAIRKFSRTPVYSRLIETDGYYTIDFGDFESKAQREDVKLFFLCSPHNPTGRVWSEQELRGMVDICLANDVFVVCDEIHADLLRNGVNQIALGSLYGANDRIVYCTAPSKTFNLAGLQISNIFIPDAALREAWNKKMPSPNPLSLEAGKAAYAEGAQWCDEMNEYLDGNFAFVADYITTNMLLAKMRVSEGTYLAWVDLSGYGFSDEELKTRVSKAGLFIEFYDDFVDNAEGHARINIACPRSTVQKGLDILRGALD